MAKLCAPRNGQGRALNHPIRTGRDPALSVAANVVFAIFNGELDTKTNLQGSSNNFMDWLCVGANGFAQVGSENYFAKNRVEMKYLLELIRDKFPIPEELKLLCRFAAKSFQHDFGTYQEIVVIFDDIAIGDGYDENIDGSFMTEEEFQALLATGATLPEPKETSLHDLFWKWFNEVESFDIESEEITQAIECLYLGTLNMGKGEHLTIIQRRKAS